MLSVVASLFALATPLSTPLQSQSDAELLSPLFAKREASASSRAKDWASAESKWEKATELNPTDATAWLELGRSRYELKKFKEAVAPLERADELGVSYPWDMPYFVACCQAMSGQRDDAMKSLKKAIDLGFRDLHLAQSDDDLKSLHEVKGFHELVGDEDVSRLSRTEGWRHDLRFFLRELHRLDYRLVHSNDHDVDDLGKRLDRDIPNLTDNQLKVRFMELASAAGDGHTHIRPPMAAPNQLPVQLFDFPEGVFITAAPAAHEDLLGSRIVAVDRHPIAEVKKACARVTGAENSQWLRVRAADTIRRPWVLNGLGIAKNEDSVSLELEKDGTRRVVNLKADSKDPAEDWIWIRKKAPETPLTFKHKDELFAYDYLPESKTVYFAYNGVSDDDQKKLTIAAFAKDLFGFIDSHDVDRLIVDIRWNGGGNNFLNQPLLLGLIKSKVNLKGNLFVITGQNTFSAAMCFAEQVERYTNAIFCGEPTGSSPNFIGESIGFTLPYSKLQGSISDLYWQNSVAMDHRVWISPAIYVPYTFASYSSGKDPVIDAIFAYRQ